MANEFGGPTPASSFLTGLAGSIASGFKDEHDKRQQEDAQKKAFDYQLLVKAMDDPNITPSQARELLSRAADIYKPKGHGGIKENLKQIFGGEPAYTPQAGNIISDVMRKPKLNAQAPTQTATPGGTGADQIRSRTVTLPSPPQSKPEQTYREQDLEDKERLIDAQLNKQLEAQTHADFLKNQQRLSQNAEIRARTKESLNLKSDAQADLLIRKKMTDMGMFEDTPENRTMAAAQLHQDREDRRLEHQAKLDYFKQRNEKMVADIKATNERIDIARQHLNVTKQNKFKELPQVKQADVEINKLMNESQRTRILASQASGNYAETGDAQWQRNAVALTAEAEKYEKEARDKVAFKESYLQWYEGRGENPNGVRVPDAPSGKGGAGRSGTKLTVSEATAGLKQLHPDWNDVRVNAAIEAEKAKPNSRIAQ